MGKVSRVFTPFTPTKPRHLCVSLFPPSERATTSCATVFMREARPQFNKEKDIFYECGNYSVLIHMLLYRHRRLYFSSFRRSLTREA